MAELNLFALNGITVEDGLVRQIFKLHGKGAGLNWELLHKAKDISIAEYPDDYDQIMEEFETNLYWTKKKLAKQGSLHAVSSDDESYDDEFEEVGNLDDNDTGDDPELD